MAFLIFRSKAAAAQGCAHGAGAGGTGMPKARSTRRPSKGVTFAGLAFAGLAASALAADRAGTVPLRSQPLPDLDKVADMITVEYAPGQSTPAHRHNAHVFVYVLEGSLLMGVKGKEPVTVAAGQTFYESPTDVHEISRNASDSKPAKFLVLLLHDPGASTMLPADK
jgi:quercetin dioxygenase-like cupin family protein